MYIHINLCMYVCVCVMCNVQYSRPAHDSLFHVGHKPYKITFSSDYFGQLYDWAVELIKR